MYIKRPSCPNTEYVKIIDREITHFWRDLMTKKIALLLILVLLSTGCVRSAASTPGPPQEADTIATLVAATLTVEAIGKEFQDPPASLEAIQVTLTPDPDQPTEEPPTAEPSATPTTTATATITLTPTITQTPTATLVPTLAPEDPVLSLGVPDVKDTFDSGSIIYQYDEDDSSFQVDDGDFVLTAKKAISYETWSLSWEELTNFYLEITGTFGDTCGGKDRYGLFFRAPDTSQGYLLGISCDGSYRFSSYESEEEDYTNIKPWASSDAINKGPGGTNRLGIMVKGTTFTGYINGMKVFKVDSSTFSKGRVGVMVAASNTPGFKAYLSEMVYWKLP